MAWRSLATQDYVQTQDGLLVAKSLVDAKGDLLVGTAADTLARLPVGTNGQVLTADSVEAAGVKWAAGGGGGAPTTADYLVGTIDGALSNEIVVGTSPGGELGGTWASPTVDATHSGSAHADFVPKALVDAKGDLLVASAADTVGRLPVGANGQVLTADAAEILGVKWAAGGGGGGVASDVIWDAAGDLAVGSGPDAATRLPLGVAKRQLRVNAAASGLEYIDPLAAVVDATTTSVLVVNSTTESQVVGLTLPGGYVGVGDLIRLSAVGSTLNNTGANVTYTHRLKFGGVTLLTTAATSMSSSTARRPLILEMAMCVRSLSSSQPVFARLTHGSSGTTWQAPLTTLIGQATAAADLSVNQAVEVTTQMGTASASAEVEVLASMLEVVRR